MSGVPTDQSLLFAFDENYARPALVALGTALSHSPSSVKVSVASVGLTPDTVGRLHRAASTYDRELTIVEVEDLVDSLPTGLRRFSPAAWARIFVDRVTPATTDRIVYLDADTYCRRAIRQLFEIDLAGAPLAAVPDLWEPTHELRGADFWTAASTRPTAGYFNSGVMVIDRSSWVAHDVTAKALRVISERRVPTRSVDQDILNAVLEDQWVPLPSTWNTVGTVDTPDDARIVHFIGDRKPWHSEHLGGRFEVEYRREAARLGWTA
jgi:lipopolysaccharide biosynthesis glycosyltransferase